MVTRRDFLVAAVLEPLAILVNAGSASAQRGLEQLTPLGRTLDVVLDL